MSTHFCCLSLPLELGFQLFKLLGKCWTQSGKKRKKCPKSHKKEGGGEKKETIPTFNIVNFFFFNAFSPVVLPDICKTIFF